MTQSRHDHEAQFSRRVVKKQVRRELRKAFAELYEREVREMIGESRPAITMGEIRNQVNSVLARYVAMGVINPGVIRKHKGEE